jgi:O-antigen/teichoic acid export membrane protein
MLAVAPALRGTVRVFLAESLIIPSGLLTAAYLARRLGPEGYGLFAVMAALVAWIEWSLVALFSRASVRFVADATDWRPIGATILSIHLLLALAAALLLFLFAPLAASALGTPAISGYLRVFALDIPFFSLAHAHRNILVGLGSFTERAWAAAARWVGRLLLIVLLVELGLSITGAILGTIGASVVELAVARRYVRPAFSVRAATRMRHLLRYGVPLLLSALALRLFDKLDLVSVTALGGTAEWAGLYAAAQNLSILPGLIALSFSPVLLSVLTRAVRDGEPARAWTIGREAMRILLLVVPFGALVAGASAELVSLVFGPAFAPAAPLLSLLIVGATGLVFVSVSVAMLTAAGQPARTLAFTVPVPLLAVAGYLVAIPRHGATGAALVTAICAGLAALAGLLIVGRVCGVFPPGSTLLRSAAVSLGGFALAVLWPAPGWLVVVKLTALAAAVPAALLALGEFSGAELAAARSLVRRQARAA